MNLTKDNFESFWTSYVGREERNERNDIYNAVMFAIEDAEKYQIYQLACKEIGISEIQELNGLFIKQSEIVERLKKRIEELENKKYEAFEQIILDELQKILEGN